MEDQKELAELMLRQEVRELTRRAERRSPTFLPQNGRLIVMLVLKEHIINFVFWNAILDMAESETKRLGYLFQMHVADDNEDDWRSAKADGYLFLGNLPQSCYTAARETGRPIVWIDCEREFGHYSQVRTNNRFGAYLLARRAVELGHRRLAFYGSDSHFSFSERREGVLKCVREFSADGVVCELVADYGNAAEKKRVLADLLTRRDAPTYIQCASDSSAQTVYAVAHNLMMKIPDDLSVAGFDNIKEAHLMEPPLTTVEVPRMDMAVAAVELLIARINAPMATDRVVLMEPSLIMRDSLAAPDRP